MATNTRKVMDQYSNVLYDSVTESAANTLTFESVDVGLNIFDKVGLLISKVEYYSLYNRIVADGDSLEFGLSSSNGWSDADAAETSIIDYNRVSLNAVGTAATALERVEPFIKDFSTLPGGGILITPKPLYLYAAGANLGNPATVQIRMFFTIIKLRPEEYFELLESRQYFG